MGSGYLIDSNAVIDFLMFRMPNSGIKFLSELEVTISIINRIEIFCKVGLGLDELTKLNEFIYTRDIYQLSESISLRTIDIRLNHKLKMPDAIIAAIAMQHNLTLITHNIKDFAKVSVCSLSIHTAPDNAPNSPCKR